MGNYNSQTSGAQSAACLR